MFYELAPMEAVNCASFRVLCKRRGADIIYTNMIDVDEFVKHNTPVDFFINPQSDENPLVVQIAGYNKINIKKNNSSY